MSADQSGSASESPEDIIKRLRKEFGDRLPQVSQQTEEVMRDVTASIRPDLIEKARRSALRLDEDGDAHK